MKISEIFQKKFAILQEISYAIIVTDNVNAIANLILDLSVNYTQAEKGSLMLLNDYGELTVLVAKGIDSQFIKDYKIKLGEGIAGTVASNRQCVLVKDIDKDPIFKDKKRDHYKTRSFISCPIIIKNKLLGVININDKKNGEPFNEDEEELIKVVANHAAIAIENAYLMDQFKSKTMELYNINKKIIEDNIAKNEFVTQFSHEMRTPLNSIKGSIFYLQQSDKLTRREQTEFYNIISKETDMLISIVENLIDFIKLENETKLLKKSVINLKDLLVEVINSKFFETNLSKKNIRIKLHIKDSLSDIIGDKIRLIQLFLNLFEGLSYYLEKDDVIDITAIDNDIILLKFSLSRKIPDDIIPYLLHPKFISDRKMPEELLRLSIFRKIADIHNWDLSVEYVNNNTLIMITIPKSKREKTEAYINQIMSMFVELISELMNLNICSIMFADELTGDLTINSAKGLDDNIIKRTRLKFGDRIAGWVAIEGKPLLIEDIENDPRFGRKSMPQYNTKSLISLPLKIQDKVIGVLNLSDKRTVEQFSIKDLYIASIISERISDIVKKFYSGEYDEIEFDDFISSLEKIIDVEKRYQKKKSLVPDLMFKIMDKLGATEEDKKQALFISMIYDLGLMILNKSILDKKNLSAMEVRTIKSHPYNTIDLIKIFELPEYFKKAILHHHERYDGTGYPNGLKGTEIPLISRVLLVVDSFISMIEARSYRKAFTYDEAMREIKAGSGSIYDPNVVKALEEVI